MQDAQDANDKVSMMVIVDDAKLANSVLWQPCIHCQSAGVGWDLKY